MWNGRREKQRLTQKLKVFNFEYEVEIEHVFLAHERIN